MQTATWQWAPLSMSMQLCEGEGSEQQRVKGFRVLTTLQTPCETGLTRESVLKANCTQPHPMLCVSLLAHVHVTGDPCKD